MPPYIYDSSYVVFDGEAVVVDASVQTRQEIMSAIEQLNPGASSY